MATRKTTNMTALVCVISSWDISKVADKAANSVCVIILTSGIALHSIGIHCLRNIKTAARNQNLLLINLSCSEIIVIHRLMVSMIFLPISCYNVFALQFYLRFASTALVLSMAILSLDRLLNVLLLMKYKVYITESRTKKMIALVWFLSIACCPAPDDITYSLSITVFALTFLTTYAVIAWKMRQRRLSLVGNNIRHNRSTFQLLFQRHFIIPFFIVITCGVFYVVPVLLQRHFRPWTRLDDSLYCLLKALGLNTDPLIYVFLSKETRKVAMNLFRRMRDRIVFPVLKQPSDMELQQSVQNSENVNPSQIISTTC